MMDGQPRPADVIDQPPVVGQHELAHEARRDERAVLVGHVLPDQQEVKLDARPYPARQPGVEIGPLLHDLVNQHGLFVIGDAQFLQAEQVARVAERAAHRQAGGEIAFAIKGALIGPVRRQPIRVVGVQAIQESMEVVPRVDRVAHKLRHGTGAVALDLALDDAVRVQDRARVLVLRQHLPFERRAEGRIGVAAGDGVAQVIDAVEPEAMHQHALVFILGDGAPIAGLRLFEGWIKPLGIPAVERLRPHAQRFPAERAVDRLEAHGCQESFARVHVHLQVSISIASTATYSSTSYTWACPV